MSVREPRAPDVKRDFNGALHVTRLAQDWAGIQVELNSLTIGPPARSELCVASHTLLCVLRGGASSVTVMAEGLPAWQGPKLVGAAGFFPAGQRMVSQWPAGAELSYVAMFIDPAATDALVDMNTASLDWRARSQAEDPFVSATAQRLAQAIERRATDTLASLLAESLATALHLHLAGRFSNLALLGGGGDHAVDRAITLILDALPRATSLAEMVAAAGLPRARFLAAFRRRTGVSPHQFILKERLERARRLLETTRLPVSEIAQAVGCTNAGHLSGLFRKHLGTTPSAWRVQRGRF